MRLEISPNPPEREAEVVAQALVRAAGATNDNGRTPWWRAGVRANLAADPEAGRELS